MARQKVEASDTTKRWLASVDFLKTKYNLTDRMFSSSINMTQGQMSNLRYACCNISINFLEKTLDKYQEINGHWLLTGRGRMLLNEEEEDDTQTVTPIINPNSDSDLMRQLAHKDSIIEQKDQRINELTDRLIDAYTSKKVLPETAFA